jgi:predicted nucleic acid-binding protein
MTAAVDARDTHHAWASAVLKRPGIYLTCEAAVAEAVHLLKNNARAVAALRVMLKKIRIAALSGEAVDVALRMVEKHAPRMDYADACALVLMRDQSNPLALTVDTTDFTVYRVPFFSPAGLFC